MATQELEAMVRELRDRELIKEVTHQYAHCVRQNDIQGVVNLFAEDGVMEMDPTTIITGRAELRKFYT